MSTLEQMSFQREATAIVLKVLVVRNSRVLSLQSLCLATEHA